MILQDPGALQAVEATIRDNRVNAEAAVQTLIRRFERTLGSLEGDSVRGYASDVSDPWQVVLEVLLDRDRREILSSEEPVVLAADELTPQVVTFVDRDRVLAVVTEQGGRYSHGAVLANAFGVPCVVGLPNLLARLEQGMDVAVDGDHGTVQLRPTREDLEEFQQRTARRTARQEALRAHAVEPGETRDGHRLTVRVNVESLREEIDHSDGVGLLRTEFLYLERPSFPSEEEQYRMYRRVVERMGERPVTLRTLDIGGDKPLPYFKAPAEANPALGWRGIRISLEWRDLLRVQLRALLRASVHGRLRILLPMIASLEEVREVRDVFEEVRTSLRDQGYELPDEVPVGIMIEVPSAVFVVEQLLDAVDFVSVGTNDLVQYLLAVDRDNSLVSRLYDPGHPAVMSALSRIAEAARAKGKPCSVCGEMAADAATAVVLLGLGYDEVSVVPRMLPEVKFALRNVTHERARRAATDILACATSAEVQRTLGELRDHLYGSSGE
jgi:phosphotransferase system enzyme I (PtsI)